MMGIFTRFTLRTLGKNRVRTVVTVVGIALSAALLAAVLTSVASVQAGMYERTLATEGSWHVFAPDVSAEGVDALAKRDQVSDLATFRELGSARLSAEDARYLGDFIAVKTLPTTFKGSSEPEGVPFALMPEVSEGRLPEASDEVILPDYCKGEALGADGTGGVRSEGALDVGSTLALDLGARMVGEGEDARVLTSTSASRLAGEGSDGEDEERLVDATERTFTVVGFYEHQPSFLYNNYAVGASSPIALAAASAGAGGASPTGVYLVTKGVGSLEDMKALFQEAAGLEDLSSTMYHTNLFRYLGIADDRPIWGTLWAVAAVLAAVIVVASVSLIYNAFAISVAERTRQFGLLASLGASKRQLRRSVLVEALLLGAAGVPVGLALGVAGTVGVFAASQEAFASMLGTGTAGLSVHVDAGVLAIAAALSLATLLVSAWVPAARASRVSAVDAIRQSQDVRLSKRAEKRSQRTGANAGAPVEPGIAGKLFGVPGFVAHRNLSRAKAGGRTVVASLAVSVTLIVVTGSIAATLEPISDRASSQNGAGSGADIVVSALAENAGREYSDLSDHAAELDDFLARASNIDGLQLVGATRQGQAESVIPADMITSEARDVRKRYEDLSGGSLAPSSFGSQGDYLGSLTTFYLDDASWRSLAEELGVDEGAYTDDGRPRAIGLDLYQDTLPDGTYVSAKSFARTGSIDLYALAERENASIMGVQEDKDGGIVAGYLDRAGADKVGGPEDLTTVPLDEVAQKSSIEVAALAPDQPAAVNAAAASNRFPVVFLHESVAAQASGDYHVNPFAYSFASFSFTAADHGLAADELEQLARDFGGLHINVADITEIARQDRLVAQSIQLFVLCFSVITMLIAVANVFNTLANGIILRTREFAVLRSVGMGNRAFARMLGYECASYALRGLAIGMAVATAAAWALYQASALTFAGTTFSLPWPYVGLAVAVVLAVLALSVAYALHRSHAASIVESLRTDAI